MPKANNIVTTAHSQAAEMRALFGGQASTSVELVSKVEELTTANAALTVELEQAHAEVEKLSAALAAATKTA